MPRLILIANRLPVIPSKTEGGISWKQSMGGLATGMASLADRFECVWIGYSGLPLEELSETEQRTVSEELLKDHHSLPVFLTRKELELYYEGFSNETIWPLFHYFPLYTRFDVDYHAAYQTVNRKFAEKLMEIYQPGDLIWVQDYHLMLLPGMLRNQLPQARIGFFLHIPFPAYELFRLLPWRKEILEAMLGADLIGFHTPSYMRHFLDNIGRILGLDEIYGEIRFEKRVVKVDTFPMGIDFRKFNESDRDPEVKKTLEQYKKTIGKTQNLLSVDRLDYTKGIPERLRFFEKFLLQHPEYHEKLIWVLIAAPSRTDVEAYDQLASRVSEEVGRINGQFETLSWTPIRYFHRPMPFTDLAALYALSDVMLVTPLRDGMNLVAKEYAAVKKNGNGVLILSEMAGVAEEFSEALLVNPYSEEDFLHALETALSMPMSERRDRMKRLRERTEKNSVFEWATNFTRALSENNGRYFNHEAADCTPELFAEISQKFRKASSRLIFLDYDGTLVHFRSRPEGHHIHGAGMLERLNEFFQNVNPIGKMKLLIDEKDLNSLLNTLAKSRNTRVVIVSGRDRQYLEKRFKGVRVSLASEHGAWTRPYQGQWTVLSDFDNRWKDYVRPLLELTVERTPGSLVEEKEFSLAWHYRQVAEPLASSRAGELKSNLLAGLANRGLQVLEGDHVLEIKPVEIHKGKAVQRFLQNGSPDFILAIGDDRTDEDLFRAIPQEGFTFKVGDAPTTAKYRLKTPDEVRDFLEGLC